MTCRYSNVDWRDALYNAVRNAPGGVIAAAAWLSDRRGKQIAGESLRKKLRALEGESLSMEMAELLTEWLQESGAADDAATGWIQALAVRFEMAVDFVPPAPEGGWPNELNALRDKAMGICQLAGNLSGTTLASLMDNQVDSEEEERLVRDLRELRSVAHRMERNLLRIRSMRTQLASQAGRA